MKVVIVGAGNVATILGRKMQESGADILQVISRTKQHGSVLAGLLNAVYAEQPASLNTDCELCLIAVNDQHIETVAEELPPLDAVLVHTAGSVPMQVLKAKARRYGVIYPLQTLNKRIEDLPVIPVMVDGNNDETRNLISTFTATWSPMVTIADDEKRLSTHVAAVIANNFTNHLMSLTEEFCIKEGIDFSILLPLVRETVHRLGTLSPALLQTGPAIRGDIATIDRHLQLLNRQPVLRNLYLKLSESIIVQRKLNSIEEQV